MFRFIVLFLLFNTLCESNEIKSPILCIDKNSDCTAEFCRKYPYTAKERCAKTCGHCSDRSSHSSTITSGHHRTATGIDRFEESAISSFSPKKGNSPVRNGLCFDRSMDCKKETCRDFPYTAKEQCAKTCGFCSDDVAGTSSSISRSSSGTTFGTSLRLNDRDGVRGSSGNSHHSSKHGGYDTTHKTPSYSTLSKDKELECTDLNDDCTQQFCKDYPFTARARCTKTCGFCRDQLSDGSNTMNTGDIRPSLTDRILVRGRSPGSDRSGGSMPKDETSAAVEDCRDEDSQCSPRSCREHPYKARTKCAKTCGFCSEKISQGPALDLRSSSVDSSDDGIVINLKNDDTIDATWSTAMSGRHLASGNDDGKSQFSSIGSRSDSSRRSSSSVHIQQSGDKPYLGVQRRYPGRSGPCTDENEYCENADCKKYPRFSQRYCEKTCGFC